MTVHTILVVEDTPANMKLTTMLLRREGYRVLQADNAMDGISLAKSEQPDLVLMDIQLPGMDGLTAIRMLHRDPATRHIKLIALTAHAMKGDEQKMINSGCDAYVAKPISYKSFLEEIKRILAKPRPATE
ncbi:MAG: response regulator [Burkholderiaceae bacterium]|nr:response regulator [Burkholderiaceae bacterium]